MASSENDVLLALALQTQAIAATLLKRKEKKTRSVWVRKLWKNREQQGHYNNLIAEMRLQDHSMHFNYFRMLPSTFDDLLHLVGPSLVRQRTRFREPLPPALRLAVAVRYLATADEAFPLKETIQRPYPGKNLTEKLRIFNYRLSRARRVVENAFGILSGRWRFLRAPIQAQPDKAAKNVLAAIGLHNWLKKHDDSQKSYRRLYCPVGYVDYEDSHGILHKGIWRSEVSEAGALADITQMGSNNYPKTAERFRALMADFFVSPQGELPWQYTYVRRTSYEPVH
eukprot:gene8700-14721_t